MKASSSFKILYFIIPLSFILGLSWGIDYKKKQIQISSTKKKITPQINISAPEGLISKTLIDEFTEQTGIIANILPPTLETNYIQTIIKNREKLDLALINRHMIPTLKKLNLISKHSYKNIRDVVSADFLNLKYDPKNKYFIPFAWNFYEIAYDTKKVKQDELFLSSLLKSNPDNKLIDINFYETYYLLKKTELISDEWIKTQREDLIQSALKRLLSTAEFKRITDVNNITNNYKWVYTSHVKAQKLVNLSNDWKSRIPEEKSNINILLWTTLTKNKHINRFLNFINEHHEEILKDTSYATTFKNSKLKAAQSSSYIRSRSLLRLEMKDSPQVMEGIWSQSYKEIMPIKKQTSASNIANH